jgi:hypothetical protein
LPYQIFGLLSGYGHSIPRPFVAMAIPWLVAGTLFQALLQWQVTWVVHDYHPGQAHALSFSNIVSFPGFQRA